MQCFNRSASRILRPLAIAAGISLISGCYWLFPQRAPLGLAGAPGANPAATLAYVASLDFSVQDSVFDGWLACEDRARCDGADSVRLRIVPEARAHRVPVDKALNGGNGYIVAMIRNLEGRRFHPYGLGPNETAYLWVGSMQSGPRRIAIIRVAANGSATTLATAAQAGWCPPAVAKRTIPAVHINEVPMCTGNVLYSDPRQSAAVARLASSANATELASAKLLRHFSHARGLWFSCSMGCCEARGFQE